LTDTPEQIKEAEGQGWQADFEGDNKKSAAEFLHDGKFFTEIKELKSRNKKLEKSFDQLTDHYEKVRASDQQKSEQDYLDKIEKLNSEKVLALDEGDNQRVVAIDEQIRTTEKPTQQPATVVNGEFDDWLKDNNWYDDSEFLRVEADSIGQQYYDQGKRGKQLFSAIENHIKRKYPADFENEKRSQAPTVEGGTQNSPRPKSGKVSTKDLTRDERQIFENFKANGIFKDEGSVQKYLREVVEIR